MWEEALDVVVGAWTNDVFSWEGKYFKVPPRRVHPKPLQQPHPPLWVASTSPASHELAGQTGLGLLSFTIGVPPEELAGRIELYRKGLKQARPAGKFINDRAATFTMVHVADTNQRAYDEAAESMVWYPKAATRFIGALADWMSGEELGSYQYAAEIKKLNDSGLTDALRFDHIRDSGAAVVGDPDRAIELAKRYEAAGCDLGRYEEYLGEAKPGHVVIAPPRSQRVAPLQGLVRPATIKFPL